MNEYPKKSSSLLYFLSFIALSLVISACGNATPTSTTTPTQEVTPEISPTPTLGPLGSSDNPLVIGYDTHLDTAGQYTGARQQFTEALATATGLDIQYTEFSDPRDLIAALKGEEIQLAWLQPLTYIYAQQEGIATIGLLSNHFGTYFYGTQFLANVESGFEQYFSSDTNTGTADAATALAQFDGARPCWVEPGSISGYIYPAGLLDGVNVEVQDSVDTQSFTATIRALYVKGICDFGATFAISGDPRTSSAVITDLPDVLDRVVVIWQSNAEIPNLNLSYSPTVPEDLQRSISTMLVNMLDDADNRDLLTQALSDYDVEALKVVDDSVYDPLRDAIDATGTDVSQWIGR
jgi:phosphonate transport system substrate-binding protein